MKPSSLAVYLLFISVSFSLFITQALGRAATIHDSEEEACDHGKGICVRITKCDVAMESVKVRGFHKFERCGFVGSTEIVCCPETEIKHRDRDKDNENSSETNNNNNNGDNNTDVRGPVVNSKRKCVQVCEKYSNEIKPSLNYLIIKGENADIKEFPHMAALGYRKRNENEINWHKCAGSLISEKFVLTAAHCFSQSDYTLVSVRLGVVNLTGSNAETDPQDVPVEKVIRHPDYSVRQKINDIAIVKLKSNVKFSEYVHPACLYSKDDDPLGLVATGWGIISLETRDTTDALQKTILDPFPLPECKQKITGRDKNLAVVRSQICTYTNNTDSCEGDSGGPLQVQNGESTSIYSVVGITSYGFSCAGPLPAVYTRVYSYLDWIEKNVWPDPLNN